MSADVDTGTDKQAAGGALLRVSSQKISRLMDLVGELSLSVSETVNSPDLENGNSDRTDFDAAAHRLSMIVREVQDAATELRLVPVEEVFKRLKRMIRELERQTKKKINLDIIGADTAIDKMVADRLYDPLLHVLRNSADHGLEGTEERVEAGKSEKGTITLSAAQVGSEVQIVVGDDGRGLNRDRILSIARKRGFFGPEEEPEDGKLWKVIFEPGFSTAEQVSNLSGRGVGMDVLNSTMRDLRGRINVDSWAGKGTNVTLHIPVSLAFLDCILLRQGTHLFAVPVEDIAEIVNPGIENSMTISAGSKAEMLRLRDTHVPVCRLETYYGDAMPDLKPLTDTVVIVLNAGSRQIAVPVDEVLDRQQVVMKPLSGVLAKVRASWGCALLGTGEVALVLDADRLASGEEN